MKFNPNKSINIFSSLDCTFCKLMCISLIALLSLFSFSAFAEYGNPWQVNLIKGVTEVSNQIYDVHMIVVWVSIAIATGVYLVLIYSLIKHRKSKHPTPARFHENLLVESIWTIIPLFILIAISVPATKTLLNSEDSSNPDMSIKITGYQWKWEYDYLDEDIRFFSNLSEQSRDARYGDVHQVENYIIDVDNPLVIPAGKKVRFLITSNDVIHSWWVPEVAVKQDAIPGFINATWTKVDKPGIYRGQCAELCGKDHAYMPAVLEVKSEADYKIWLASKKAEKEAQANLANQILSMDALIDIGEKVYNVSCAACHGVSGAGVAGVFPAMTGSPVAKGDIIEHTKLILFGVAGTAMQAFGNQLSDVDVAAVVTYERNRLGNSTGDIIQPSEVAALRGE